jgi:hypothetical protein
MRQCASRVFEEYGVYHLHVIVSDVVVWNARRFPEGVESSPFVARIASCFWEGVASSR